MSGEQFDQSADEIRKTLKLMGSLADMQAWLGQAKMVQLEAIARDAGVEKPASRKDALVEQVISTLLPSEGASVGSEGDSEDESPSADDEESSGFDALPDEGGEGGAAPTTNRRIVPRKFGRFTDEELVVEINGWEINEKVDGTAYSRDWMEQYLAYLWEQAERGVPPASWMQPSQFRVGTT